MFIIFIKYYDKQGDERTHAQIRDKFNFKKIITAILEEHNHIVVEVVRKGQLDVTLEMTLIDSVFFMEEKKKVMWVKTEWAKCETLMGVVYGYKQ